MSRQTKLKVESLTHQLDLIPKYWREAPKRWGHPLHSLCSYFAMFPPHIPRIFIEWLTEVDDIVFDPFSGRGTAPLEACRLGRIGLGSDANPLAFVLTAAKVDPPNKEDVLRRLDELALGMPSRRRQKPPEEIKMLYSPKVLRQLCWLRDELNIYEKIDRFIMAAILGIMHANYKPNHPARGLSISMPNTFSMSPEYVKKYIAQHELKPPNEDVLEMVRKKLDKFHLPFSTAQRGRAWQSDARSIEGLKEGKAKLIFTSPPYLGVIKYGKYNWIRLWLLGHQPKEVDNTLVATSSLSKYITFMSEVLSGLKDAVRQDGYVCLMIGDVKTPSGNALNLAEKVWEQSAMPSGWRKLAIVKDELPEKHKVSRIWGHEKKGNATKVDRILILAPPSSNHDLPPLQQEFSWKNAEYWSNFNSEETNEY